MRSTVEPVPVGDATLPQGADVLLSPYLIHRDARFFDERFDPDRWLPERARQIPRKAFLPFGAGPHKCIGDAYAWTEMVIVLATLCSRWRFRLPPQAKVAAVASVVPRPDGLLMIPDPRVPDPDRRRPALTRPGRRHFSYGGNRPRPAHPGGCQPPGCDGPGLCCQPAEHHQPQARDADEVCAVGP